MTDARLRGGVGLLALLGAGIAAYLVHAQVTGGELTCSTGGCATVQGSRYAELAGVPVAALGLAAYAALLASAAHGGTLARSAGAAVALSAFAFSSYLLVVQVGVIGELCDWCLASDGVVSLLALLAVLRLRPNP